MALINIDSVGAFGLNKDEKDYTLDPAVWTEALNMRAHEGQMVTRGGAEQVFSTLSGAPYFLMPVSTSTSVFWIYVSLTQAYAYDGSSHANISRAVGGNYTTQSAADLNGIVFGGIAIVNNGRDVPQYWSTPALATDLAALPNWTSTHRAKVIRSIGPFLVALHITEGSTIYPHMVRWSHPADPGSVPTSWDVEDTATDAGETDLPDSQAGVLLDGMLLRGQLYLYKENSTWRMRYIGGTSKFSFDTFLDTSGILATRCVQPIGGESGHFVVTQDDIIAHDGTTTKSLINKRMRRAIFNSIDTDSMDESFVYADYQNQTMNFCYPTAGASTPNRSFVWNYKTGAITEDEVDFVHAASGTIELGSVAWSAATETWLEGADDWSTAEKWRTLAAKPSNSHIILLESGTLWDGSAQAFTLQRTGIALVGEKRDRTPIVDFNRRKMVTRVWPRITGGPVDIRMGSQASMGSPVLWGAKQTFDPETQEWLDLTVEGKALAIEFSSLGTAWQLEGYKLELVPTGIY